MRSSGWSGLEWLSRDVEYRNRQVAFHYTNWLAASSIADSGIIRASHRFDDRCGPAKPPGIYATFLHPFGADNSLERIKLLLFRKPRAKHIDAVVVLDLKNEWMALLENELVLVEAKTPLNYKVLGIGAWNA